MSRISLTVCAFLLVTCGPADTTTGSATKTNRSDLASDEPDLVAGFGTATIDGVQATGEWDSAGTLTFPVAIPSRDGGGTAQATLFAMNDGQSLYLAVRVAQQSRVATSVSFDFDTDNDGQIHQAGDDAIGANYAADQIGSNAPSFFDDFILEGYGAAQYDTAWGGTIDGASAGSYENGQVFIEMEHPLHSGDARDFAVAAGDTLGVRVYFKQSASDQGGCTSSGEFDGICWAAGFYPPYGNSFFTLKLNSGGDTTPPDVHVTVSPGLLWPPNGKLVRVAVQVDAQDDVDPAPVVRGCTVQSSEGDDAGDIVWRGGELWLRAARYGHGSGRTYSVTCTAVDASGNVGTGQAHVVVPHDARP